MTYAEDTKALAAFHRRYWSPPMDKDWVPPAPPTEETCEHCGGCGQLIADGKGIYDCPECDGTGMVSLVND